MAETANIGRMAEQISNAIFKEFFWEVDGPTNINWACERPAEHAVKTHPTDVVFFYDEPYNRVRRYFQFDLKSYSKSSISKTSVATALYSLAKQVSCAEISDEWQKQYLHQNWTAEISGVLFIYNHDNEFDKDFDEFMSAVDPVHLKIGKNSKLYILGPDDINWLDRVCNSLKLMRGDEKIPSRDECAYYHPDLVRKDNVQQQTARSATIEMLTSPWIVMKYKSQKKYAMQGVVIFVRRETTVDYFRYIIDYLRIFQIIENVQLIIDIAVNEDVGEATVKFKKAITEYLGTDGARSTSAISERLRAIKISAVPDIKTAFSEIQIGMQYER